MGRKAHYTLKLATLMQRPSFTIADAKRKGVSRQMLAYLVQTGVLERIARGVYRSISYEGDFDPRWDTLAEVASTIPNGVICLISSLDYHNLTEEIRREHWIAIPHTQHPPVRPFTRIVRMRNIELGRQSIRLGQFNVSIFDRERSVVDAFRFLSIEIAIKALRAYLFDRETKADFNKLNRYAKTLRQNLTPYIAALTT